MFSKFLSIFLLISSFLLIVPATEATTCDKIAGKQVCLVRLKRSAKYYWEYRVILSIDGQKQAPRVYNCRDRYYVVDQIPLDYRKDDLIAKSVCRLYCHK